MKKLPKDLSLFVRGLMEIHNIRAGLLGLIIFRSIFEAVAPFINIYMSARIITGIASGLGTRVLIVYVAATLFSNLFVLSILHFTNHWISLRQFEFDARYEMKLSQKIIDMDYTAVENPQTHRHREKINELKNINYGGIWRLFHSFSICTQSIFTVAFSIFLTFPLFTITNDGSLHGIFAFAASPLSAVILAVGIIANAFISMHANATSTKKLYVIMNGIIPFNRVFGYYFNHYISTYHAGKDIRIYNQKELIEEESMSLFDGVRRTLNDIAENQIRYGGLITLSTLVLSTLIYLFVGLKALAGLFGVGLIVQYVGSIHEFTNAFTKWMEELTTLRINNEAMQVYFDYMDIPTQMYRGTLPVEKRALCDFGDNEYEMEFRNVSFQYPGSKTFALQNVSLRFHIGERMAVVGMNGSGKTTFIKLLCRLYDPTEGEILLNGINIQKYDYAEYLSLFSVVFQDFKLFSFSLGQNVAATVAYDKVKVETCLKAAGFGDRLSTMQRGVETCLYKDFDEDGVEISGGEAQKIALARALYKDAPFIVLDEPTAALDPIAEYEMYRTFNELVGEKTAIYISHRLSSCRFCDDIAVFHEGRLVERGAHDTLVKNEQSQYYALWHAQAQYYA